MSRYGVLRADLMYSLRHPWVRAGLASALVASVIFASVALFYWRPMHVEQVRLSAQIRKQRSELIRVMRETAVARTYARSRRTIGRLAHKRDAPSNQAALVYNLTTLAQRSHVDVISESYQEGRKQAGYVPLYQVIELNGSYNDVRRFLFGIKSLPTWTLTQETRLRRMHTGRNIKATVTLVTYRRADKHVTS